VTASDRSGSASPSASGALNPPPAAPLDHSEGDDSGSPDAAAQLLASPTPTATEAADDTSGDDPDPTATKKPSSSTADSSAEPTATKKPAATATKALATATKTAPTVAPTATTAPTQAPTQVPPTATPVPPTATQPPPQPTQPPPTATPTQPPPPQSVSLHPMEAAMFESHNVQRANNGVAPLALDAELVQIARQRSQTMADTNCFSHTACGPTAFDLLGQIGYFYQIAGENIARNNYPDSQTVQVAMNGFMNSPGHRANILEERYTKVGIGVAFGADGMKYFTVVFAGP
jgi:uncharacterized protein YkwD